MMTSAILWSLAVPFAFAAMWAIEARWPARRFVQVRGWRRTGLVFFLIVVTIGSAVPVMLAKAGLTAHRVFGLSAFGWWGLPIGMLALSALTYWWHRAEHHSNLLWRVTHQLHHSAQRVDIPGAFYAHPLEVVAKSSLGVLIGTVVLGLSPPVASALGSAMAILSMFQHWNVRTPRFIGWIVPRPEMHCLHHEFGVHARNYGDLPIWDVLFGTYENPEEFAGAVGFDTVPKLSDLLLMQDASKARARSVVAQK